MGHRRRQRGVAFPGWRGIPLRERHEADLFYSDLMGRAAPRSVGGGLIEQLAGAPAVIPIFPGLDISAWDGRLVWLWRWSNLRFIGFYLAHGAGQTRTTWTNHWHDLKDVGWGVVPFYLPFSSGRIDRMAEADGNAHGAEAVTLARAARFESGAAIYLDIEAPVLNTPNAADFSRYINGWFAAVRAAGYTPGAYCSRLDASRLLGAGFAASRPVLFPFSIGGARTRALWDDTQHQLTPPLPSTWDVGRDPAWATNVNTIGSQYDWFNESRARKTFSWPSATGASTPGRSVDWDVAKVWDPSHPRASAVVALATDRDGSGAVRIFTVATDRLYFRDVPAAGPFPTNAEDLALGPSDIGPTPAATESGYDAVHAAACSRRTGCTDLFVQGLDGLIRTAWKNDRERFIRHPWALHAQPARRGTPLAAVCREVDQIDVFYVNREHQLVTQWWSQGSPTWANHRQVINGPLVAGGSNLAAVKRAAGATPRSQLDVFYISLDYARPYAAPPAWNDAWRVVHATWAQDAGWQVRPVAGLDNPAAASGVAAAGDAWGRLNVVVQTRDRRGLRHGVRAALTGSTFAVADGPSFGADQTPRWWTTFGLAVYENLLLFVGITNAGQLGWATHRPGVWSRVELSASAFSTGRPIALARRGGGLLDVNGVTAEGAFARRTLRIQADGRVTLQP